MNRLNNVTYLCRPIADGIDASGMPEAVIDNPRSRRGANCLSERLRVSIPRRIAKMRMRLAGVFKSSSLRLGQLPPPFFLFSEESALKAFPSRITLDLFSIQYSISLLKKRYHLRHLQSGSDVKEYTSFTTVRICVFVTTVVFWSSSTQCKTPISHSVVNFSAMQNPDLGPARG